MNRIHGASCGRRFYFRFAKVAGCENYNFSDCTKEAAAFLCSFTMAVRCGCSENAPTRPREFILYPIVLVS
jgi:hypothetical protein